MFDFQAAAGLGEGFGAECCAVTQGKVRGALDMVLVAGAVEASQRKSASSRNKRKTGRYAGRVRLAVVPDRSGRSLGGFIKLSGAKSAVMNSLVGTARSETTYSYVRRSPMTLTDLNGKTPQRPGPSCHTS